MKEFRKIPRSVPLIPLHERAANQALGIPVVFDQYLVRAYV